MVNPVIHHRRSFHHNPPPQDVTRLSAARHPPGRPKTPIPIRRIHAPGATDPDEHTAASNAAPLPSCKPSRNGMPASRKTPVRSPNGKMMPEPGRYSCARNPAAWAVQARRASELISDSFHDIEDVPETPHSGDRKRQNDTSFHLEAARYQSHERPRREGRKGTAATHNACCTSLWRQLGTKIGVPEECMLQT